MSLDYFLFIIGFYILIKGADLLTEGASLLAKKLNVSQIIIGLVIVGIGTSLPEFSTTFMANIFNKQNLALGTVIGSNIFNILFILGITSLIHPLVLKPSWVHRDLTWNIIAILVFLMTIASDYKINLLESSLLIFTFFLWLYQTMKNQKEKDDFENISDKKEKTITLYLIFIMIIFGFFGTVIGSDWVIKSGTRLAQNFNVSEKFIGLTLVSIGTSLPELIVSLTAALKKETGIVIGNIIGSNIFDFLVIIGVSGIFKSIIVDKSFLKDSFIILISTFLLYLSMFIGKKYTLKRSQGFILVTIYLIYFIRLFK